MTNPTVRHPRREATLLLPNGHEARVLEPSPPADQDPHWYADDPTDPAGAASEIVTPIPSEGLTWAAAGTSDGAIAAYARDHWLDGRRRLTPIPPGYERTRRSLHQLAFFAIAPKRYAKTGKLGLRHTSDGFGTPFFGDDEQIRVERDLLVRQTREAVTHQPITTLAAACAFLEVDYRETWFDSFHDPLTGVGPAEPLQVAEAAAAAVAEWFGFSTHVLERARRLTGAEDVSRVQLWPEHFDAAIEMGSAERDQRASFGASPGDDDHALPYLYVAPWRAVAGSDPFWNATGFNGAELGYELLRTAEDPYERALSFFARGLELATA